MTRKLLHTQRSVATTAGLVLALGLSLSACGSDDDDDSTAVAPSGSAAGVSALGAVNEAKGEKLTVGFVGGGKSATVDVTDELKAAQAVADYANKYLGGINGRPLEFKICEDKNTPAGATDCANQMVQSKVPAIVSGSSAAAGTYTKIADPAGIGTFHNLGADPAILNGKTGFSWVNPVAVYGSPAAFARDKGIKKAAILVTDVPAAAGPATQLGPLLFGNAGATVEVVPITPGTPDMTPQVQAAVGKGVQMFHLVGDPNFCTTALKAIKTLGLKQSVTGIDRCTSSEAVKNVPNGYEGFTIISQANFAPEDPEYKTFTAVLKEYGKGATATPTSASGFAAAMNFVRVLNAAKITDYTAAGILTAVKAAPAIPLALGGGATMKCDGTASPFSTQICSAAAIVGDGQQDGSIVNYRTINSEGIYVLPKK